MKTKITIEEARRRAYAVLARREGFRLPGTWGQLLKMKEAEVRKLSDQYEDKV